MTANHDKFQEHLLASHEATIIVTRWLTAKGFDVTLRGLHVAPEAKDWRDYADSGDLEIISRAEVKHLSAEFTCVDDWPFHDFMVCAKHSWDNAKQKPYRYFYLNKDCTHMASLDPGKTRKHWSVTTRRDTRYDDLSQEFYVCAPQLAKFVEL